mmetsp:Transcript_51556/g.145327  ORF Transcript_51556/g.145327 Transcript_51556/m.145327 type:complete len:274 (+) Transcript_51556:974-1795(+)
MSPSANSSWTASMTSVKPAMLSRSCSSSCSISERTFWVTFPASSLLASSWFSSHTIRSSTMDASSRASARGDIDIACGSAGRSGISIARSSLAGTLHVAWKLRSVRTMRSRAVRDGAIMRNARSALRRSRNLFECNGGMITLGYSSENSAETSGVGLSGLSPAACGGARATGAGETCTPSVQTRSTSSSSQSGEALSRFLTCRRSKHALPSPRAVSRLRRVFGLTLKGPILPTAVPHAAATSPRGMVASSLTASVIGCASTQISLPTSSAESM